VFDAVCGLAGPVLSPRHVEQQFGSFFRLRPGPIHNTQGHGEKTRTVDEGER
jgi:hypothetical protein